MNTSFFETCRRFRGSPADEAAGMIVFIVLVVGAVCFGGTWGMVYAGIMGALASLALIGSLIRSHLRAAKSEVRHV